DASFRLLFSLPLTAARPVRTTPVPRLRGGGGRPASQRGVVLIPGVEAHLGSVSATASRARPGRTGDARRPRVSEAGGPRHGEALEQEAFVLEVERCSWSALRRRHLGGEGRPGGESLAGLDKKRAFAQRGASLSRAPGRPAPASGTSTPRRGPDGSRAVPAARSSRHGSPGYHSPRSCSSRKPSRMPP